MTLYDAEIALPITLLDEKYKNRFENFKRIGLCNIQNRKIKLVLLIGTEKNTPDLKSGWPKGIDTEVILGTNNHLACKIFEYYANLESANHAKWFIKLDDDSITDIDAMITDLESNYDWDQRYYICSDVRDELAPEEEGIIKMLKLDWMKPDMFLPQHEYEISILSQKTMSEIIQNEKSKKFLKIRSKIAKGYGDQSLALAARLSKTYPIRSPYMTWHPIAKSFTFFGGPLYHIHNICNDKTPNLNNIFLCSYNQLQNYNNPLTDLEKKIANKKWLFYKNETDVISMLILTGNHLIKGSNSENETFWFINPEEKLVFCHANGGITTTFNQSNQSNTLFQGHYFANHGIIHKLKLIED